jgi:hypothetical protein
MKLPLPGRLRAAFAFLVVAAVAVQAAPSPQLPIALLASFEEALAIVHDAAEQRIAELELRCTTPQRGAPVTELLTRLERSVAAECEDARAALDRAIATIELSPARRTAVLASIDHQLAEARRGRASTRDPAVRLEYIVTGMQLRKLRDLV